MIFLPLSVTEGYLRYLMRRGYYLLWENLLLMYLSLEYIRKVRFEKKELPEGILLRFLNQLSRSSIYSKLKSSSTVHSNIWESFNPNSKEGKYLLFSMELIVCLETPSLLDKSSCVRLNLPLYILILFFINYDL